MKKMINKGTALLAFPLSALSLAISSAVFAQTSEESNSEQEQVSTEQNAKQKIFLSNPIEEVLVLGRIQSAAQDILLERQEQAVSVDLIDAELIGRLGDSNVAAALTRVPGLTLVDGQFIIVRGLGERYVSTTLNGAVVPSPDLTRNVIPLDIIPTSIVSNISVQKVFSADAPAAFGGGSVDIRTTGVPEDLLFNIEIGTGDNSLSNENFLTYAGGSDDNLGKDDGTRALPTAISDAVSRFRANFDNSNIAEINNISTEEAQAINRGLATELFRDFNVINDSGSLDRKASVNFGNVFDLPGDVQLGFLTGLSYSSDWRNKNRVFRSVGDPEGVQQFIKQSTFSADLTANFGVGLILNNENRVEFTNIFLRNTDDEVQQNDRFTPNERFQESSVGFRDNTFRYEQREFRVNQVRGEHEFGYETKDLLGIDALSFLEGLKFNWYFSDSEASTDIPSEIEVVSGTNTDPVTGEVLSSAVFSDLPTAARYQFSNLDDYVESRGWELAFPFEGSSYSVEVTVGHEYWEKARFFTELEFTLGPNTSQDPLFSGPIGDVFSDENILDPDFNFRLSAGDADASYIAANKVNAAFGKVDFKWNDKYRIVAGLRWEDYQQLNLGVDPFDFEGSFIVGLDETFGNVNVDGGNSVPIGNQTTPNGNATSDFFRNATFTEDDLFASLAFTYNIQDFWAEDFYLRLSYGETTVRPDLREIANTSYFDPLTDILTQGNPNVRPASLDNYDVRAEWFFDNGNNLTLSVFYKDIINPIDIFQRAATDGTIAAAVLNGESAEITGLEIEFYNRLGNTADFLEPFFIQGNFTFLDHELIVGGEVDSPTNQVRGLAGASDFIANVIFGFDSDDGKHAATLAYNFFGERLFFAGRLGQQDVFEQPFNSLNATYSYYPTDNFTVKLKLRNLLNEDATFEQSDGNRDVVVFEEERGQEYSLSVKYTF